MDILGIGPTELVFIILIALILLGPKDMEKVGRTIGRFLRDMTQSEGWRAFRDTSREIRNLPNRLMREANIEDIQKTAEKVKKDVEESADVKGFGTWSKPSTPKPKPQPPQSKPQPAEASENQIAPPKTEATPSQDEKPEKESNKETDKESRNDA
ncbi:MAG: twin-arginine translocase TatA/TatE family subunit [Anaerolineales bacterium]|jgi:sec-independent protein translocase protein TatB